jgi:hypothetical protein
MAGASLNSKKLHLYEFICRTEERDVVMQLSGIRIEWEPLNETFVLFKLWNENDELSFWHLTDKSASCKILSSQTVKKASRSGNLVKITQESDGDERNSGEER